jgi:hypothetical protein
MTKNSGSQGLHTIVLWESLQPMGWKLLSSLLIAVSTRDIELPHIWNRNKITQQERYINKIDVHDCKKMYRKYSAVIAHHQQLSALEQLEMYWEPGPVYQTV